jgi:hypothetical protein
MKQEFCKRRMSATKCMVLVGDDKLICQCYFTGAVMGNLADRLLGLKPCIFLPQHANNLQNEFRCFTNYDSQLLNKS